MATGLLLMNIYLIKFFFINIYIYFLNYHFLLTMKSCLHFTGDVGTIGCYVSLIAPHDQIDGIAINVLDVADVTAGIVSLDAFVIPVDVDVSLFDRLIIQPSDNESALLESLILDNLVTIINVGKELSTDVAGGGDTEDIVEVGVGGEGETVGTILLDETPLDPCVIDDSRPQNDTQTRTNLRPYCEITRAILHSITANATIDEKKERVSLTDIVAGRCTKESSSSSDTSVRIQC